MKFSRIFSLFTRPTFLPVLAGIALATAGCGADADMRPPGGIDPSTPTASLLFCNQLPTPADLELEGTSVRLHANSNECAAAADQPCSLIPAGEGFATLYDNGRKAYSMVYTIGAGGSILVTAAVDKFGYSSLTNEKVTSPTTCAAGASVSAAASKTSCRDLKNCRLACSDDACKRACDDVASPAAKTAYDAVMACVEANRCSDDLCAEQKCGPQLNACLP
jgi:hypothetical protein